MKKPLTNSVFLGVVCERALLAEIKETLAAKGCIIQQEEDVKPESMEKEWYSIEEVFPDFHAGKAVRGLRYRENLTQKQLAEKIGVSIHNLSHMENGRRTIGKEMAKRLGKVLNNDWRQLMS